MRSNRFQFGLTLLTGLFLLAVIIAALLYAFAPQTPASRGPLLLAAFIALLIGGLLSMLFILRWLLRPYQRLVNEAERASVKADLLKSQDEAEFVLETFQSVVAQLQEQRKELERLSAEARERASSAEKFGERIIASLPSGLLAFDGNGASMAVNGPARQLLELEGTSLGESFESLLRKYPELLSMVSDCLHNGTLYRRTEIEAITHGQQRWLGATIAPIEMPQERGPHGALCLLMDITEVTELREQVALKKNLESLGEMSAGLAHEFKNAVAALHGYVQLLQTLDLNDKAQTAAASLLNEVRSLSTMVTAFLNFARPQPLQLEEVVIDELLSDCAAELEGLYRESEVELQITHDEQPLKVGADERMLRQSFLNLLRNAAEAIPEGKPERQVSVRSSRDHDKNGNSWVQIEIRDTGSGIAPAQLQKIFIPFFTTKPKGHGVGLALTHRVITEHGGTLTAANNASGGALFTLRLPM